MAGCNNSGTIPEPGGDLEGYHVMTAIKASYWGYPFPDRYQGNYSFFLTEVVDDGVWELYLDINAEVLDAENLLPASGTYTGNELTLEPYTFIPGWYVEAEDYWYSSSFYFMNQSSLVAYPLKGGTVTITAEGNYYTIDAQVTIEKDGAYETVKCIYKGMLEVEDRTGGITGPEPPFSNLEDDVTIESFDFAFAELYGERYTGDDTWGISFISDFSENEFEELSFKQIYIELQLDPSGDMSIPDGRYEVLEGMGKGYIIPGNLGLFFEEYSWYYDIKDDEAVEMGPLAAGYMDVTYDNGNDEYTCVFAFTDDLGYNITGTYTGPIDFEDKSDSNAPVCRHFSKERGRNAMRK